MKHVMRPGLLGYLPIFAHADHSHDAVLFQAAYVVLPAPGRCTQSHPQHNTPHTTTYTHTARNTHTHTNSSRRALRGWSRHSHTHTHTHSSRTQAHTHTHTRFLTHTDTDADTGVRRTHGMRPRKTGGWLATRSKSKRRWPSSSRSASWSDGSDRTARAHSLLKERLACRSMLSRTPPCGALRGISASDCDQCRRQARPCDQHKLPNTR